MAQAAFGLDGNTTSLSPNAGSVSTSLTMVGGQIRVVNLGTTVIYLRTGTGSASADTSVLAMLPSTVEVFSVPPGHDYIAAYCVGAGSVSITSGSGI